MNGVQVDTVATTRCDLATSTNQLQIGGDSIYGQYFNGPIDEVRVYNTALTAAQIQTDMATPVGGGSADTQPPTAPTNLTATAAGSAQINLSWAASTDNVGVTGYRVERCQGAGCTNFAADRDPRRRRASPTPASPPARATATASARQTPRQPERLLEHGERDDAGRRPTPSLRPRPRT